MQKLFSFLSLLLLIQPSLAFAQMGEEASTLPTPEPTVSQSVTLPTPTPQIFVSPSPTTTPEPSTSPDEVLPVDLDNIPADFFDDFDENDFLDGTSFLLYEEPPSPEEIFLSIYQKHIRDWLSGDSAWWKSTPHVVRARTDYPVRRFLFRSLDGFRTNVFYPSWGQAGKVFARYLAPVYGDTIAFPAGSNRPSVREISNLVVHQNEPIPNQQGLTDFFWLWGQFVGQDLVLIEPSVQEFEQFKIRVPIGDSVFDPEATGTEWLKYSRSDFDATTSNILPREQKNLTTPYLDASMIYGVDEYRSNALRTFVDGKLKMTNDAMLPYNTTGLPNVGGDSPYLSLSGDVRVNEHIGLVALHTLFFREHNRLAAEIKRHFPNYSDEEIFFFARELVTAEIQDITYNEFLPLLLGEKLPAYSGYDPQLDPTVRNLFASAAFELWYTMMSPQITFADNDGVPVGKSPYSLRTTFFQPWLLWYKHDLDFILKGFSMQPAQAIDPYVDDALRNFTFEESGLKPVDLIAVSLQRGRDHGLPDYNQIRSFFGREPMKDFSELSSDIELNEKIRLAYRDVDAIDAWVGLLAEEKASDAPIGETLKAIVTDQFLRIRNGDRFWHERALRPELAALIPDTSLAQIIKNNTDLTNLTENIFVLAIPEFSSEIEE